jgi:hypothetical protein
MKSDGQRPAALPLPITTRILDGQRLRRIRPTLNYLQEQEYARNIDLHGWHKRCGKELRKGYAQLDIDPIPTDVNVF